MPHTGDSQAQVLAQWGAPTARYPATGDQGERWQYSYQPSGRWVFNIDFNVGGNVARVQQALDETLFPERIRPGQWTTQDVLREYGPPMQTIQTLSFHGDTWIWRYQNAIFPRLLYVNIDPAGVVQSYTLGDEYLDPPDRY